MGNDLTTQIINMDTVWCSKSAREYIETAPQAFLHHSITGSLGRTCNEIHLLDHYIPSSIRRGWDGVLYRVSIWSARREKGGHGGIQYLYGPDHICMLCTCNHRIDMVTSWTGRSYNTSLFFLPTRWSAWRLRAGVSSRILSHDQQRIKFVKLKHITFCINTTIPNFPLPLNQDGSYVRIAWRVEKHLQRRKERKEASYDPPFVQSYCQVFAIHAKERIHWRFRDRRRSP